MKNNWQWKVAFLWETLPSSLQDRIRTWGWDALLGFVFMMAYFAWEALKGIQRQPWELIAILGLALFTCILYLAHFIRKRIKFGNSRPSSKTAMAAQAEETQFDHYHNRRTIPLRIEFSDNYEFKSIGDSSGIGIQQGHLQIYRVAIHNITEKDIEGVQIWLTKIDPMPSELMGHIPLPLHVTHELTSVNTIALSANEKRLIDVVSFFDRFWHCNIRIEHTSTAATQEVYQGDDAYEIELMAKGKDVPSSRRRFKIGVKGHDLFMESLDQPAEEAMQEGFDSESHNL